MRPGTTRTDFVNWSSSEKLPPLVVTVFVVGLSFGLRATIYTLLPLLVVLLFRAVLHRDVDRSNPLALIGLSIFIFLFGCEAVPILLSDEKPFYLLERKLVFMLLPLLWYLGRFPDHQVVRNVAYKWFVYGNVLSGLVCLSIALGHSLSIVDGSLVFDSSVWGNTPVMFSIDHFGNYFFSEHFSFFNHPTYWGVAVLYSLALVVLDWDSKRLFRLHWPLAFFLLFLIILISSRLVFMLLFVSATIHVLSRIKRISWGQAVFVMMIGMLVFFVLYLHPRVSSSIDGLLDAGLSAEKRPYSWKASLRVIAEAPLLGSGPASHEMMMDQYVELGATENLEMKLNAHNQFLESWMFSGISGLIAVVSLVVVGFRNAISSRCMPEVHFCVIVTTFFLVESVFGRFQGVSFVTFFFCLHLFVWPRMKTE